MYIIKWIQSKLLNCNFVFFNQSKLLLAVSYVYQNVIFDLGIITGVNPMKWSLSQNKIVSFTSVFITVTTVKVMLSFVMEYIIE